MPRFPILPLLCITCFLVSAKGQGLRVRDPYIQGYHPLDAEPYIASPLNAPDAVILELRTTMFKDTAQIDFEKRQVTFRRFDPLGYTMWEFHYPELTDYLTTRNIYSFGRTWKKELALLKKESVAKQRQALKLEWELPVQYPTWAQRVLGKEPPKLSIDGFLEITLGYANTQFDEDIPAEKGKDNNDFKFDVNYSFGITGSVGRLINLNIRADKEQNFDISNNLKNFKIEYKEATPGELEDEVIQEVIVGYTGFSMPGTNLSGYSESHEGLFGIKVKAQLGPLQLTTIASTEQGQSNKKSYSSGSSTNKAVFKAKDFSRDRYFFLDTLYRRYYIKKYAILNGDPNTSPPPQVTSLSVWRSFDRSITDKKSHIKEVRIDSSVERDYLYERLERDRHYFLDDVEGYIRFADSVTLLDNQSVAIYLRTEDSTVNTSLQKGAFDVAVTDTSIDTVWNLWTLRPLVPIDSVGADPARFNLMWRNVYGPADFGDQESFELAINLVDDDKEERVETRKDGTFFTDLFGLAEKNVPLFQNTQIFNVQFNDLILPPFDTGATALEPFNNSGLEIRDSLIYRYGRNNQKLSETGTDAYRSVYEIVMSGSKKQTTFDDLGWGIMQGTEVVKADGITLERDRDYTINYDMGVIDLTSARAKAAEKIDIEYQSEALFIPERKMFLGTHGKLNLPFISDKSYAGTSLLFQSTESNDDIPRLDQEPYSKMLFDINTHLEFEPEWMTKLANALPLVKTEATSSVTMDIEFANSRVNPNKRDKAYVDDFEDSKQSDPFSNSDDLWFKASPPVTADSLYSYPPAWNFYWFTPTIRDQVHKVMNGEIVVLSETEKKQSTVGTGDLSVLRLHVTPSPRADSIEGRFAKSWAGIMHPISQSFANKEQMQYFEFFVKAEGGFERKGKLKLQMGVMREDISLDGKSPNGRADREDTAQIIQTQTYDENLDLGWDKLKDEDEVYYYPAATPGQWAPAGYGNPLLGIDSLDPARDNYREYRNDEDSDPANYRWACGEQGDASIQYSEDINFDGVVQTAIAEQYFEFTIDLADDASPFIDRTVNYADTITNLWRKYRIPLHEIVPGYEDAYEPVNNPTWSNITMLRVIWTDFDSLRLQRESQLIFWNMEFVGNQWMEVADDSSRIKVRSSVVNSNENDFYEKELQQYDDLITRERNEYGWELEQSLRLNFVNLVSGDTALVEKSFQYQTLNLSAYEKLSLLVFGDTTRLKSPQSNYINNASPLYSGDIRFVFRFGTDDSTYYEYSRPIYPEWRNEIQINLKQLSDIKDAYMVGNRDSVIYLETPIGDNSDENKAETIRIRAPKGRQPNFSRIKWMAMGVICNGNGNGEDSLSGEIWVNEMKLVGIKNINGWASRADFSTKMADLLSLQARMEYENGDFRRMTENQNLPDNSQVTGSMGASIGLDKFLPGEWGVSIPAGVTYNSSIIRPQLKNETDVYLLNNGKPDAFFDIVTDAAASMVGVQQKSNSITRSEKYQTNSVGRTYYTSYKKSNKSDNPFVSFLADRWSADARYSTTISELRYGEMPDNKKEFYAKCDTSDIYSGKVQYDLSPHNPPEWMKWSPLKKLKNEWLPSQLKSLEFSLLPRRFSVDVADLSYNEKRLDDTWRDIRTTTYGYTVRHNTTIDYSPISPILDMNYSLSINRDMVNAVYLDENKRYSLRDFELPQKGKKIFRFNEIFNDYYVLWGEKDRTQHAGFNLNPRIFNWLTTSANYNSDYRSSVVRYLKDSTDYLNTGVKSGVTLNGSLNFDQLLNELKKAAERKPAKDRPSRPEKRPAPQKGDDPKKRDRDTVKTTVLSSLVDLVKKGFETIGFRQISLNYTADSDLKNNYVSPELLEDMEISNPYEMLLYQFGVRGRTLGQILSGEMDDHHFLGVFSRDTNSYDRRDFFRNDSRTVGRTYRLSSGLNFKPLELSFRSISLSHSINYNIFNDSTRNDTTVTFPDFSVGFSTSIFNKIDLIKKNLSGISLSSSYSFRETNRITTAQANNSSRTLKMDMMPLISFSGSLKRWPIKFDYRHNYSTDLSMKLSEDATPSDTNKHSISHSDEFTLKYEIDRHSKLSEIKLLTWTIPIKGKTTIGLKFNRSTEVELIQRREDKSFSLMPNLSYIFTDNVTGRIEYTIRQIETEGKTRTTNDFAVVANIRF